MVKIIADCDAGEYEYPAQKRSHPGDKELGPDGCLLFLGLAGQCKKDGIALLFLARGVGGYEADVLKAVSFQLVHKHVTIKAGVVDAFRIFGVEAAVFLIQVRQGHPCAWLQVFGEALNHLVSVFHMVHSHGADDEIKLGADGLIDDVLANDFHFALEFILSRQLL